MDRWVLVLLLVLVSGSAVTAGVPLLYVVCCLLFRSGPAVAAGALRRSFTHLPTHRSMLLLLRWEPVCAGCC